jgi:alkanesulfonate monooxygenase SsuD/methylene tetrahydromethanopterin reductase-like flavin-dependent oxidoreductase (luciferase family)
MKFGLFIMGTRDGSYREILDQMIYAEELGFDSVVLGERHFRHSDLLYSSPLSLAAAIAARTKKIRIGTAARILSLDHPIHLAEDTATLDILSGGRLDFGATRASLDEECHLAFHSTLDETRERFMESIDIIINAWTKEQFSYEGKFYRIPEVSVFPKPIQKPHPPVSIVAVSDVTLRYAARKGYSVITGATRTPKELEERYRTYFDSVHPHTGNSTSPELIVNRFIYVSETDENARREMEEPFLEFIKLRAPDLKAALISKYSGEENFSYKRFLDDFCLFGSPETVAGGLRELASNMDIGYFLCSLNFITQSHALCLKSTELFAREVIPDFRVGEKRRETRVTG